MSFPLPSRLRHSGNPESTFVAYAIFFMTGAAMVMPGTLLPLLAAHWRMGDGSAGIFFLCFSVGSSSGALLARGKLSRVVGAGCALIAVGAALLGTRVLPQLVVAVYGCGLGLAMTSISLLRSRQRSTQRISELSRLNLTWALGAGVAPPLLLHFAVRLGILAVLHALAGLFVLFSVLALTTVQAGASEKGTAMSPFAGLRALPIVLLCLIPLATGTESGTSNWLSSYIMRGGHVLSVTISTTAAFGWGLICSRLLYSRGGRQERSTRLILRLHPALVVTGIFLLMLSRAPAVSIGAAMLIGFGIGPMYPLALALLLDHNEAGNAGFFAGGFGASVVPMSTGLVSGWTHSLRTGLGVLLASGAMMAVLSWQMASAAAADGKLRDSAVTSRE